MAKSAASRVQSSPPTAPQEDGVWPSPVVAALLYFGLSFVFFLPAFLPGQHIFGTDYQGGSYYFFHFVSERLAAGDLPKWVPYIFGGMPHFANPGSTYQPIHFLSELLLPLDWLLATVFVAHFTLAGFGMYMLARELGCRRWIAFISGLSYQFTGILLSWVYAGHDGRIIVASTAPLLFYFLHRGVRRAELASFLGVAGTLSLALLSFQIQNSYYVLLGGAIWAVFCIVHHGTYSDGRRLARVVAMGIGGVAFAFVLSAVNYLPFQSYVSESPRGMEGGRGYEYSTSFSMPVPELLSMAVPEHHGASVADPQTGEPLFPRYRGQNPFKLHTEYVGVLSVLLLALGIAYTRRERYWQFFAGLGVFMLTIALGGNTPIYRLYYEILPGTKQFRAPSLSFFVVAMALAVMAALTLERIARVRTEAAAPRSPKNVSSPQFDRLPWIVGGIVAAAFLGMILAGGSAEPGPSPAAGWGRFALFAALAGVILWRWSIGALGTTIVIAALTVVNVADLWSVGRKFMHTVDPPGVTFAADDVMLFMQRQEQPVRMWTFPYPEHYRGAGAYGGNYPMLFEVEQVGGEHPNMLQRWNEYVGAGTETYIDWHNLIADPAVVDHPDGYQAISFRAAPGFLNAAAIRFVVSMAPLMHPDLQIVHQGSALVYENTAALPRAYLVEEVREVAPDSMLEVMLAEPWEPRRTAFVPRESGLSLPPGPLEGSAEVVSHTPDRVVIRTSSSRDALLVLADNYLDGWTATVSGTPVPVIRTNHTFRGVPVSTGTHEVVFEFNPVRFELGLYITLVAFTTLLVYLGFVVVRSRRGRAGAA